MASYRDSPYRRSENQDIDPYAPVIVEDLLQGQNEWRNIQDIVRLTFKALSDVVKTQGEALREMERQMTTRASKAELNSGLAIKANISDVSRTVAEVATSLDSKTSLEEVQSILDEKVTKSDLQYLLSNKVSIDEVRSLLESKADQINLTSEIGSVKNRMDDLHKDLTMRVTQCASQREVQYLQTAMENKANLADMNEALGNKANKQSVANALHRKANRADIDSILTQKADIADLRNVLTALETKVDDETLETVKGELDTKPDRHELQQVINALQHKAEKEEMDVYTNAVQNQKYDFDQKLAENAREVDSYLKVLKDEIDGLRSQLHTTIAQKVETRDFERALNDTALKTEVEKVSTTVQRVKGELSDLLFQAKNELITKTKTLETSSQERLSRIQQNCEFMQEDIYKVKDSVKTLSDEKRNEQDETNRMIKNSVGGLKTELVHEQAQLATELDHFKKELEDLAIRTVDKSSWHDFQSRYRVDIDAKVSLNEVQTALTSSQSDIAQRLTDYREDMKLLVNKVEDNLLNLINKKSNISDLNTLLLEKADVGVLRDGLKSKATVSEVEDIRMNIERISKEFETFARENDLENHVNYTRGALEDVGKDMLLKANIKDVCTLLDMKSNIDDVNKALTEVHKELDQKSAAEELTQSVNDQALINEALCAENCVARWLWKSGEVKSGYAVPWEVQSVNTCPDNFLWEKDKTSVLTVAPGLYEIYFGFFAKKKPTVQLLVNGEPVLSAVNSASYVIHHSSGKLKNVGRHSAGNITGLTLIDFIALPARARIAISYSGEGGAEGFVGLRKL
eukprot:CAMPEP_0114975776 /NCGR_PEP_ID=MMETSP0216-20121206/2296_1 /TAXON_ID=223996 /ORGANISM="Protocruzia adherens, Strain Boccale" /LENGTH=802 /DNA_ID=CAMNT_0002336613 /DNA_START=61 /DNA_END=2469 /DNA_ORIENTATION=+